MRSNYTDDYGSDYHNQFELFRANVDRSMRGRLGQARLRELRDALLAMPVKELQAQTFAKGEQDSPKVCALGAWALQRCGGDVAAAAAMVPTQADDYDTSDALQPLGWPRLVVFEAIYINDEVAYGRETPAQRYARVLSWVNSQLIVPGE